MTAYSHSNERRKSDSAAGAGKTGGLESGAAGARPGDAGRRAMDWQGIWFDLRQHAWQTLVLIPVDDARDALGVGEAVVEVARCYERQAVDFLDATDLSLEASREKLEVLERIRQREGRVIVTLDPILTSPAAIPIARAADAAVLIVRLETSGIQDAREVVEKVGEGRFVGSIAIEPLTRRAKRAQKRLRKQAEKEAQVRKGRRLSKDRRGPVPSQAPVAKVAAGPHAQRGTGRTP